MAAASNVKKYTIRHIEEEEGAEVEIPVYPTSTVPSDNLVSKSWNNMYGVFKDIPVNLKAKVNWIFDAISEDDLETLYGDMIRAKIVEYKSRFFVVNTHFPGVGFITGTFYLGTPTNFKSLGGQNNNGEVSWYSGEIHWIEVDGIQLNNPTITIPN